jgi:SAM-dependent methyltransferase
MQSYLLPLFQTLGPGSADQPDIPCLILKSRSFASRTIPVRLARYLSKALYNIGLGFSASRYEAAFHVYLSAFDKSLYSKYDKNSLFCNFGSGAFYHPRWKNYDYPGESNYYKQIQGKPGTDFIPIDLCDVDLRLPLENESVSLIYCSHTLEHIDKQSGIRFLAEAHRALVKGGIIRIVLPNLSSNFEVARVIHQQTALSQVYKNQSAALCGAEVATAITDLIDQETLVRSVVDASFDIQKWFHWLQSYHPEASCFHPSHPHYHVQYYSYEMLSHIALDIGYSACIPVQSTRSMAQPFLNKCVFDTTEPTYSIYAELIK